MFIFLHSKIGLATSKMTEIKKEDRVIRDRIRRLDEEIQFLESIDLEKQEFVKDKKTSHAVLYSLIVGIEAVVDSGNHILSYYFSQKPESYKDIIKKLGECKIITKELVEQSIKMPDFRNLAIHIYHKVDEGLVYDYIPKAVKQFKRYSKELLDFVEGKKD